MDKLKIAAVALAVSVSAVQLARADSITPVTSGYIVHFADLNLASDQGAATLYARLQHAARRVCEPLAGKELDRRRDYRACLEEVVSTALAHIDRPSVTERYQSQLTQRPTERLELASAR
jgi:UrcA family protein